MEEIKKLKRESIKHKQQNKIREELDNKIEKGKKGQIISILEKITSKYILKFICSFFADKNYFLKIIVHSKSLQKKLNVNLIDYKEQFYKLKNWNDIIESTETKKEIEKLIKKLNIDTNSINRIIFNYYNDTFKNVDLFSPFIDFFLSSSKNFENTFIINIELEKEKDEENILKILNKIKYNKIHLEFLNDAINYNNYLKELNIDFTRLKYLSLLFKKDIEKNINFAELYNYHFSIAKNLTYLKLIFEYKLSPELLQDLNNFKSLKKLYIQIQFTSEFIFKLKNIEELKIYCGRNITFEKDSLNVLKSLDIFHSQFIIIKDDSLKSLKKIYIYLVPFALMQENNNKLNFPELDEYKTPPFSNERGLSIINFKNLKKLKYFKSDIDDFLSLGDNLLEKVAIGSSIRDGVTKEINMIKKLTSIKTIKEIDIKLYNIKHKDLIPINNKNYSAQKIKLEYNNDNTDFFDFYNLIYLFPNLSELNLNIYKNKGNPKIILEQNKNCHITKLDIKYAIYGKGVIKVYCKSYYDLEKFIIIYNPLSYDNVQIDIPIFNRCFNSPLLNLKEFHFESPYKIFKLDIFQNLENNITNMPNLIKLCFICDSVKDVKNELYIKFLEKIFRLKYLKEIIINIAKESEEYYSLNELKNMFPKVNLSKFKKINIKKLTQTRLMNKIYSFFYKVLSSIYYFFAFTVLYFISDKK